MSDAAKRDGALEEPTPLDRFAWPEASAKTALWLLIVGCCSYLLLSGGTFSGIQTSSGRFINLLLSAAILVPWLTIAVVKPEWRPRSALSPGIAAILAAFAISSTLSWDTRVSIEMTGYAVLLALLYLFLRQLLLDRVLRAKFGRLLQVLVVTLCVAYLAQVSAIWIEWWGLVGTVAAPPLRPQYAGLMYDAPIPIALIAVALGATAIATVGTQGRQQRVAVSAISVLVAGVSIITASRAVWLGILAGSLMLLAFYVQGRLKNIVRSIFDPRHRKLLLATAAAVVVSASMLWSSMSARIADAGGGDLREHLSRVSLEMFMSDPISGSGPGTWAIRRAAFTSENEPDFWSSHAHSIYAQTLAEFGLLGVAAAVIASWCLLSLLRLSTRDSNPETRRMAWAAAFVIAFAAVEESVGFSANLPAVMFAMVVPIAWLDAATTQSGLNAVRSPSVALTAGALVAGIVTIAQLIPVEVAARQGEAAIVALAHGQDAVAAREAGAARGLDPRIPLYGLILGLSEIGDGDPQEVHDLIRASAEFDDLAEAWVSAADASLHLGHAEDARSELERAARLGRQRASAMIPSAEVWLRLGDDVAAADDLAAAFVAEPSLVDDPWFQETDRRHTIWARAVDGALDRGDPIQDFEIALRSGLQVEAARAITEMPTPFQSHSELVVKAWAGDEQAFVNLEAQAVRSPLDERVVGWCARLAARSGDAVAASRFQRWLDIVDPQAAAQLAFDIRVRSPEASAAVLVWTIATDYGYAAYRRASPAILTPRDLPSLERQ